MRQVRRYRPLRAIRRAFDAENKAWNVLRYSSAIRVPEVHRFVVANFGMGFEQRIDGSVEFDKQVFVLADALSAVTASVSTGCYRP